MDSQKGEERNDPGTINLICNTDAAFSSYHLVRILDEVSRVLHYSATTLQNTRFRFELISHSQTALLTRHSTYKIIVPTRLL